MAHTPRFFQPLTPSYRTDFCIPTAFLKHLGPTESNTGNDFVAVLRDKKSRGNEEHKTWRVKVDSDGRRFLDGWQDFATDHSLRIGDFLVFEYLGDFVFEVMVFDTISAFSRPFSFPMEKTGDVESKGKKKSTPPKERAKFKPSTYPYFLAYVKPSFFKSSKMIIPINFARPNNLENRWCEMILIDQKGRTWPVSLRHVNIGSGQTYFSTGWKESAVANKLKVGDSVVYELLDNRVLPVMKFYKDI